MSMWFSTVGICIFVCVVNNVLASNKLTDKRCGEYEYYDTCIPKDHVERCGVDPTTQPCSPSPNTNDDTKCTPGCRCRDNIFRNEFGYCDPKVKCSQNPPICGPDEVPIDFINGYCGMLYCGQTQEICVLKIEGAYEEQCRCKDGMLRDETGDCIPAEECGKCDGPNEHFRCGGECDNVCATLSKQNQTHCPTVNKKCRPKCYCEENYARDDCDICVPINECPGTQPVICGPDEVYTDCVNGGCGRWYCSQPAEMCISLAEGGCRAGCHCKEGLLRAEDGTCVPADRCPPCWGQNEWPSCADPCPETCESIDELCKLSNKEAVCKPECRCRDGFYRNKLGECISKENCLKCTGPHEYFSCGGVCDNVCATLHEQNQTSCPINNIVCNEMCYCEEGYARNTYNICVPISKCSQPTCGPDEVPTSCIEAVCERRNCSDLGQPVRCVDIDAEYCTSGCICKNSYLRDDTGKCVPIDKCPNIKCKKNEVFDVCPPECPGEKCGVDPRVALCLPNPKPGDFGCNPSCRCRKDYLRNELGECIPKEECPKCKGPHEVYSSCGGACDNVCATLKQQNQTHCPIANKKCNQKCYCEKGYARDENGICIPIHKCPPACGINEVYDICVSPCPPRRCDVDERTIKCRRLEPGEPGCRRGCRCADNFYNNTELNVCVPRSQCPGTQPVICGPDEIFSSCVNGGCGRWNCSQPGEICIKLADGACREGCHCRDGLLRDDNGSCIPANQCPKICGENEVPTSCFEGVCERRNCTDIGKPIRCVRMDPRFCTHGCLCKESYLRDSDGKCVPIDKCSNIKCGRNEVFDVCPPGCPGEECGVDPSAVLCRPLPDTGEKFCDPSCRCREGYLRNNRKECIPKEQCPKCKGPHEIYSSCGGACDNVCATLNEQNQTHCPIVNIRCNDMCYCEEKYARDKNGICIPIHKCPPPRCPGPNEYFSCGGPCDNVCATLKKQNQTHCPIVNKKCKEKCYCKEGYARDNNSICVPIHKCPPPTCGINEVYDECIATCPPRECGVNKAVIRCAKPLEAGDPKCKSGCRCADNFLRNKKGICVPEKDCPVKNPVVCGPDEVYSSCVNGGCGRWNCSQPGVICVKLAKGACREGCHCKDGMLRRDDGVCVPADKCPKKCGENEVSTLCFEAVCERRNCTDLGKSIGCVRIDPRFCTSGCLCKDSYLRDSNGQCVPVNQCPHVCRGQNEVPGCRSSCPMTCDSLDIICEPLPHAALCQPECRCKEGFYRDRKGVCISKANCLRCKGPNEYYACSGACDNVCATMHEQNQTHCPIMNIRCNDKCYCDKGYARDGNNVCVPISKCPKVNCKGKNEVSGCHSTCPQTCESIGKRYHCPRQPAGCQPDCRCKKGYYRNKINECISQEDCQKCTGPHEYFTCGGACDNVCATLNKQNQTHCPIVNVACNKTCYCEKGYARDENNTCVPISECPKPQPGVVCGSDEVYSNCANSGCGRRNCSQTAVICIDTIKGGCKEGCHCKEGLLRADNGTCIPADQCPAICHGKNEVSGCRSSCPPTCESLLHPHPCPRQLPGCKPECRCKEGYYKNKIGECITKEECLKCAGPNEYFSCGGACDNVCDTLEKQNQTHCPIKNIVCNKKCYCEEGYARDNNGTCIPISKCPVRNCKGKNEVSGCHSTCPQTCESIGKSYSCPLQPAGCQPDCRCKKGYYRNKINECISQEDCQKCTGPHEYFTCGGACDNVCATLNEQNQTHCPIANAACNKTCYCEEGYARDKNNTCVPISECPKRVVCGSDEVYSSCANAGCGRWNCSQEAVICIDIIKGGCKEGCHCKEGLLRADNGTCIPADQCPAICHGKNEVSGCRPSCPQTCEGILHPYPCALQPPGCKPDCRCKDGYFRNKIGECISKEECLKCTGPNEYFSCGGACDNVCETLEKQNQTHCPIKNIVCNKKCYCEKGYARDKNGTCVPISKCPPKKPPVVCGCDEVYSSCVNGGCGRWKCSQPGIICIDLIEGGCREGCRCKKGLLRADNGTCIPAEECPLSCYGQNEVSNCNDTCPQTCESIGKKYLCTKAPDKCVPKCRCEQGYYRNKINECISKQDCLKCTGPHEYFSCRGACDNECATLKQQNQTNCPIDNIKCNEKCYCEEGYARDNNGICIPISECPQPCDDDGLQELEEGAVDFTGKFLSECAKLNPDVSLVFSPFSVLFLLAQIAMAANGASLQQLLSLLHFQSKTTIWSVVPNYLDTLNSQQNITFSMAQKTYASDKYPLSEQFKSDSLQVFKAEAQNLNFCKNQEAADVINDWVAEQTHDLIKDIVTPDSVGCDTALVLANAIYYKGDWKHQFNPQKTKKQDFYINKDKKVTVNMMKQTGSFKYAELSNFNAQVLEMPYENDNFTFLILLPNSVDGINDIIDALECTNYPLRSDLNSMSYETVDVSIPTIHTLTTIDLKEILPKANVTRIFQSGFDLSGMLKDRQSIYVSSATQKAALVLNESGSEAAAATVVIAPPDSIQPPANPVFIANHPFVYFMLFKGTPFFAGLYYGDI